MIADAIYEVLVDGVEPAKVTLTMRSTVITKN